MSDCVCVKMGKTQSKQVDNTGTVVNTVEISEVHQAELIDTELFVLLYILVILGLINLLIRLYKVWQRNMKRKYVRRAASMDQV